MFDLKKVPTDATLDSIERNRYEHAVFLTYSLDIPFFETSIMRPLVSRGCQNIVVLGDAQRVSSEVVRLTEPSLSSRKWRIGRNYSLTPVHHSSAFHPKVALLVGKTVDLFIGSGNLEPGGMRGNLEMFHGLDCDTEDPNDAEVCKIVSDVWHYIRNRVAKRVPRFVLHQLAKVEEAVPWITTERSSVDGIRLVAGPDEEVVPLMQDAVGNDKVETLYIMSPFFDAKLETLVDLKNKLKPKRIVLLLQSETVSIPGDRLKSFRGLEAYELGDIGSRYAHAKLLIAECRRGSVMLAGSHNVSFRAFGGKNYEVSILRSSVHGNRFSDGLGITEFLKNSAPIEFGTMRMRSRPEPITTEEHARSILVGAQLDGNKIEIETRKTLSDEYRLVPYLRNGAGNALDVIPYVSEARLTFALKNFVEAQEWIAVGVRTPRDHSVPVPLLQIEELLEQAAPSAKQRIRDRFDGGFPDLGSVEGILKDFQSLLWESHRSQSITKKTVVRSKEPAKKSEVEQLTYEDFMIPLETDQRTHRSAGGVRHDFDLMIHAIAAALGDTKEPAVPLKPRGKDDLAPDEFLARTKDFAAELQEKDLEAESQLAQTISEAQGQRSKSEATKNATTSTPNGNNREPIEERPTKEQLEWESNKRLRKMLRRIIEGYPRHLASSCQGKESLPFELLDQVTSAGHLITSMLGRKKRHGIEDLYLVTWDDWADFHSNLLHVLISSENRILQKFPWSNSLFEYQAQTLERFVTYVTAVQTLAKSPLISGAEARARLSIGLFRVMRILGINRFRGNNKLIEQRVTLFFGSTTPDLPVPRIDCDLWANLAATIVEDDKTLRRKFTIAGNIADAGKGATNLEIGDWIWWPHADGHIAVVVDAESAHIEAAYEPFSTKTLAQNYVVKLSVN